MHGVKGKLHIMVLSSNSASCNGETSYFKVNLILVLLHNFISICNDMVIVPAYLDLVCCLVFKKKLGEGERD